MPIAPVFALSQTDTHVIVEIRVPHVRVSRTSLQVELTDHDSVLHFASVPVYLLRLNFAPHQFQPYHDDNEHDDADDGDHDLKYFNGGSDDGGGAVTMTTQSSSKVTFLPLLQNGTVRIELAKLVPGVYWPNLDLIGRLVGTTKGSSHMGTNGRNSDWLHGVEDDVAATDVNSTDHEGAVDSGTAAAIPESSSTAAACCLNEEDFGLYGFGRLFHGVFTDFHRSGLAQEMLEGPWDETTLGDDDDDCDVDGGNFASSAATHMATLSLEKTMHRQQHMTRSQRVHRRRRQERLRHEDEMFDADRYLGDWVLDTYMKQRRRRDESHDGLEALDDDCDEYYDSLYDNALHMQPHWATSSQQHTATDAPAEPFFTESERIALMSIPYPLLPSSTIPIFCPHQQHRLQGSCERNSNRPASNSNLHDRLLLGLLDILFAYVYDHLMNDGEPNVESAWTITKLSASLSWLEDWLDQDDNNADSPGLGDDQGQENMLHLVRQVVHSSTRRALIWPYIRTVTMARHVWGQVALLLRSSTNEINGHNLSLCMVVRCLLQIRSILQTSDVHYLGNKLYIDPYLAWLQQRQDGGPTPSSHLDVPPVPKSQGYCRPAFERLADAIDTVVGMGINDHWTVERCNEFKASLGLDLIDLESDFVQEQPDVIDNGNSSNGVHLDALSSSSDGEDDEDDDSDDDEHPERGGVECRNGSTKAESTISAELQDLHIGHGSFASSNVPNGNVTPSDGASLTATMQALTLLDPPNQSPSRAQSARLIQEMD